MKRLTQAQLDRLKEKHRSRDITYSDIRALLDHIALIEQELKAEIPHGNNGYNYFGCRCDICTEARRKYIRKQRAMKLLSLDSSGDKELKE